MPSTAREAPAEVLLSPRNPIGCSGGPGSQTEGNYFHKRKGGKKCRWHNHKMSVENLTRKNVTKIKRARFWREPTRLVPP